MMRIASPAPLTVALLTVALVAGAGAADAQTLIYERHGEPLVSIELAEGWIADLDFDQEAVAAGVDPAEAPELHVVEISPSDGSHAWFGLWAPPDVADLEAAKTYLAGLYPDILENVEPGPVESESLNGMAARWGQGTATLKGEDVEYVVVAFQAAPEVAALALWLATPGVTETHGPELEAMIRSLRPAD